AGEAGGAGDIGRDRLGGLGRAVRGEGQDAQGPIGRRVGGAGGDLDAGVGHGDAAPAGGLRVFDAGEDGAGLGQQCATEFRDDVEVEQSRHEVLEHGPVLGEGGGDVLTVEVHRQSPADVDAGDPPPVGRR